MNVYTAEGIQSFFVSSGSYTVNKDSTVSIIAEEACKLSDLDKEAATKALAAAQVNDFKPDDSVSTNGQISDISRMANDQSNFGRTLTLIWNLPKP